MNDLNIETMATLTNTQATNVDKKLNIKDFFEEKYVNNIADLIPQERLLKIAAICQSGYERDNGDFQEKKNKIENFYKDALQLVEDNNGEGMRARIKHPALAIAAQEFQSVAYPSILKDGYLVKYKVIGNDDGDGTPIVVANDQPVIGKDGKPLIKGAGVKSKRGARVADAINNMLLEEMPYWEEEMEKILMVLPIAGTAFRKIYYDTIKKKIISKMVLPQNLVINRHTTCLETASRITELFQLYSYQIEENVRAGIFCENGYCDSDSSDSLVEMDAMESRGATDEAKPYIFIEQHCYMDLDEDGYEEPYIVWMSLDKRVIARIIPRFRKEGITYDDKTGAILRIKAEDYYVKYGFITDPRNEIYDLGYGDISASILSVINTNLSLSVELGKMYTLNGGFIDNSVKILGGETYFKQL